MDWRIRQGGLVVASGSGPAEAAKREAAHYALIYAQDGGAVEMDYRVNNRWRRITTVEMTPE